MGYAAAKNAAMRGADVTLVSGPVNLKPPVGVNVINVVSAGDMYKAVTEISSGFNIIVKAAAVGDFRPEAEAENKIKKENAMGEIRLAKNADILAELGRRKGEKQVLAGFCMETKDLLESAGKKLREKNLDMICANNLKTQGAGFGTDTNVVTVLFADNRENLELRGSKEAVASAILSQAKAILDKKL